MKNLKYIIRYSMIGLIIITLNSCELEEYNPSGTTGEAIWSSPEGFQTLVNASYIDIHTWYGKYDGVFMSETGTDLWFNSKKMDWAAELSKYRNFVPSKGNPNKAVWREMHKGLNICNAGIGRIDDAGYTLTEVKKQKLGELHFLRAFYLWHIVETWGGVDLLTEETTEPILTAERNSVDDFYEVIISDLDSAVSWLPITPVNTDEYSRATKKSAMGMLARVYLTRAYQLEGEERETYFTLARDMAEDVINNRSELGVSLWDNCADLWDPNNNKQNKEALFTISNSTNTLINYDLNANRLHMWFLTAYSTKRGLQLSLEYGNDDDCKFMPTLYLMDIFDETMDTRYEASFQEVWKCNDSTNIPVWSAAQIAANGLDTTLIGQRKFGWGDTAMYITKRSIDDEGRRPYLVIDKDSIYNTSGDGTIKLGEDYVPLKKYMDPITRGEDPASVPGYLDVLVIRLAEMYLIAAEAEYQMGNTAEAAVHINVLRTRAARKTPVDYTAQMQVSATDIDIQFILDERARELCGEHIRWFDLKRIFGANPTEWVNYIKEKNPDITEVEEHHIVRPIPQEEMDKLLNRDEFGQNPGYYE